MGNCQAIDNATLLIQHQSGRVDKYYWPVPASEIMKSNPGHYVALLLTTTLYSSSEEERSDQKNVNNKGNKDGVPLRVTRIKLLRPNDMLVLGHMYRLVTSQDVMKGQRAKKQAKILQQKQQQQQEQKCRSRNMTEEPSSDSEEHVRKSSEKKVITRERQRSTSNNTVNSAATTKSRIWQPSLNSISEASGT